MEHQFVTIAVLDGGPPEAERLGQDIIEPANGEEVGDGRQCVFIDIKGTDFRRLPSALRNPVSVSAPSAEKGSSAPDKTCPLRSGTILADILSHCLSVCVAVRSLTRIGSPPRTRSRARKDTPG